MRRLVPGLLLTGGLALVAHLATRQAFPYALAVGFEVPLAILLGLLVANLGGAPAWAMPGVRFSVQTILKLGIILLGLRLNLATIAQIGSSAIVLVLATMASALTFVVVVGRRLGVERRVALLIGIGTAVCGNSAIIATAPVLRANDREVSAAVATITLFGTAAVFLFPLVGHVLHLDVLAAGLWTGSAVPDTAQTIAAGAGYSTVGRDVATVVKLLRNVLMVPLIVLIAWAWSRYGDDRGVATQAVKRSALKAFPFFLLGFLALAVVRSARLVDPETIAHFDIVTRACFLVALAALGIQTRLDHLRPMGPRPFALGFGTAALVAAGSLAAVLAFGLGPAHTKVAKASDPRARGAWTTVCEDGRATAFAGAFVPLSKRLGARMGAPRGCAATDAAGNTVQRTSLGTARLRRATGRVTFTAGGRHWSIAGPQLPGASAPAPVATRGVRLEARVLATGIPGAGALSPVGTFHPGGPIHDKRSFAKTTRPGKVLDRTRLLVASISNFGAPRARPDWSPGAVLSLATNARSPLGVPPAFASSGAQAVALDGAVQLFSAESPAFLNRVDPGAAAAGLPATSNPLGISVNNAFGRIWLANAPRGALGAETVLDPDGRPLADHPSDRAGGVFAGRLTNRRPQRRAGDLSAGVVANALLGASPDASGRAVFAVATADGALAQVHVEEGVDGLAPPGTFAPLPARGAPPARVGMVFNWVPDRFLYVTDPGNDAVLQVHLDDDLRIFRAVGTRRLESRSFSAPVDLAPAVPEVANPAFSSNTTAAGGADLYVANRGSGTIVRMSQDGRIVAAARVVVSGHILGPGELDGIAVSPAGDRIWLSLSGARAGRRSGSVVEVPAFGAAR